ncbi:hypothetical protein [Streptomyces plumbiresistens]|uniref:hypothetical protein n=1 Tax=Streptomyces plumbiresistens TaxID=511811 RepID=UPI003CD0B616
MGRTGICFDNAAAESFFAALKRSFGTRVWNDRASARADILTFIETYHNRRRLRRHPDWGYLTPHGTRQRHHGETRPRPRRVTETCPRSRGNFQGRVVSVFPLAARGLSEFSGCCRWRGRSW